MSDNKPSYFGIIPAKIRYDNKLSNSQKLFFSEITALTQKEGYCWASNSYFANLYDVDTSTVSRWVKGLREAGYISLEYEKEGKQIKGRKIKPLMDSHGNELNQGVVHKDQGGVESMQGGYCKNSKGNNTSNNNTSKNNKDSVVSRLKKAESIQPLFDIWIEYRKQKNKYPTLFEQDTLKHKLKQWGVSKSKNIIQIAMQNGWLSLKEEYLSGSDKKKNKSQFRPDAIHL